MKKHWKIIVWVAVLIPGLILYYRDPDIFLTLFAFSQQQSHEIWFMVSVVLLPALLFCFGLPGSAFLWIIAPLYTPALATALLVIGATLGGLGGRYFASGLSSSWQHQLTNFRIYQILKKHGNFWTLCSLRLVPAFPHAIVNYSSGILGLPIVPFVLATIIGLIPKTALYCITIYNATQADRIVDLLAPEIAVPLAILASLPLFQGIILAKLEGRDKA